MKKKYLSKIIARDLDSLQIISACTAEAKVKVAEIKYLPKNKIFLFVLERLSKETDNENVKINSILKFEFVDFCKSKNINQEDDNLILKLLTIVLLKNKEKFEISLLFDNNKSIILSTEIVEVTLEDQNQEI